MDSLGWFLLEERIDDLRVLLFPKDQWEENQIQDMHYFLIKKRETLEILFIKELFYKDGWMLKSVTYGMASFNYSFKEDLYEYLNYSQKLKSKEDIIAYFEQFFIRLEGDS